jgi:hypothetical protein
MGTLLELTLDTLDEAVRQHDLLVIALGENAVHLTGVQAPGKPVQCARAGSEIAGLVGLPANQPGLIIFGRQTILYSEPGEHPAAAVRALLERVCALDLDQVRAEIEAQKQAELAVRMRRICPTARRGSLPSGEAE